MMCKLLLKQYWTIKRGVALLPNVIFRAAPPLPDHLSRVAAQNPSPYQKFLDPPTNKVYTNKTYALCSFTTCFILLFQEQAFHFSTCMTY